MEEPGYPLRIAIRKKPLTKFLKEKGLYTEKVKKAIQLAERAHAGQFRDGHLSYPNNHLFPIAYNAARITEKPTEELVCKALLHDTLEDTDITKEELEEEFGKEVAEGVHRLTVPKGANLLDTLKHLKEDEKTIRILDRISNITSMQKWDEERKERYRHQTEMMIDMLHDHPHTEFLKRYYEVVWKGKELPVK